MKNLHLPSEPPDPVDCHPPNPYRALDWRWKRACLLRLGQIRSCRKWDDSWVRRARRFQEALSRYGGDLGDRRLARLDQAVQGACEFRSLAPERTRWELEARLLAGQGDDAIAARFQILAPVVSAYEKLFYGVREHLDACDWIDHVILGAKVYTGFTPDDTEIVWKIFAYNGGPFMLERLLDALYPGDFTLPLQTNPESRSRLARLFRLNILTMTLTVTEDNAAACMSLYLLNLEREHKQAAVSLEPLVRPIVARSLACLGLDDRSCQTRTVLAKEEGAKPGCDEFDEVVQFRPLTSDRLLDQTIFRLRCSG